VRIADRVKVGEALPRIEAVFHKIIPSAPFDYNFADDAYAKKFQEEERIGKLATIFSVLAIAISCLGLFGLSSFVAERRTKELGIRKVLGATILQLWNLLCRDFVLLVVLSCFIAVPLTLYFMNGWLIRFQYRADISWFMIGSVIALTLSLTVITVSFQALRVAMTNPANSLKSE
jgi:putative ABC transport system permease protein